MRPHYTIRYSKVFTSELFKGVPAEQETGLNFALQSAAKEYAKNLEGNKVLCPFSGFEFIIQNVEVVPTL